MLPFPVFGEKRTIVFFTLPLLFADKARPFMKSGASMKNSSLPKGTP